MIRILTDSASDILPAEAEQLGVTVIPLNVTLEDGTVLRDGVDMTPTVYYGVMARCHKLPTTSQPSPELFQRFFLEAAAAGDEVVGIFLSHELSGTCQCARLAADMANVDNVLFVDSENVCLGESLLVRLAVQLRDAGKTAGQIAATLEHAKEHLHLVAVIDDLKYLRKGGRLPAAVAVAGGMLGIKPLITIKEGKVVMAGKARGLPGAYVALFKKIEELGGISTCADALAGWLGRLRSPAAQGVLLALTLFISTNAAVFTLGREVASGIPKYGYELFSRDEAAAAEYIIENTEPDALFLTRDNHDNTVATLTGRNIVCGSGSYLYFHGLNYQGQQRLAEQMLTNAEVFEANRESEGLDYVYIGYHERALTGVITDYLTEKYPIAFSAGAITIYDLHADAID